MERDQRTVVGPRGGGPRRRRSSLTLECAGLGSCTGVGPCAGALDKLATARKLGFWQRWVSLDCHQICGLRSIVVMNLHVRMPFRLI